MPLKIVLNGVTPQGEDQAAEGDACLLPVRSPHEPRLVHAEVVPAQGSLAIHDQETADDDDTEVDDQDFEDVFIKGYELLQEVEEQLLYLLHSTATSMTKRTRDKMITLGADVNNYLTTYENFEGE